MFGQEFHLQDLLVVGFLTVLEVALSIDNALVLAMLARPLPKHEQGKALNIGLLVAFIFRFAAIALAQMLMKWSWVGLLGGLYLLYLAIKHFVAGEDEPAVGEEGKTSTGFWMTVVAISFTDIAFAADSVLAAVGMIGPPPDSTPAGALHPKLWVVVLGALLGIIALRFAASVFIKLLEKFPRFESAAYLLVLLIGLKLVVDWAAQRFHFENWVDFHSKSSPAFWVFWILMVVGFCMGFLPSKDKPVEADPDAVA